MKDDAVEQLKQLSYSHKANEETIISLQTQLKEAKRQTKMKQMEAQSAAVMKKKFKRKASRLNDEVKKVKGSEINGLRDDISEYRRQIQVLKEMHHSQDVEM